MASMWMAPSDRDYYGDDDWDPRDYPDDDPWAGLSANDISLFLADPGAGAEGEALG